uniref:H1.4 linker histone, cluster member n=1 Tax=Hucho hucho TaxID=62062 RepID=A0A4W5LVG5_9TELE
NERHGRSHTSTHRPAPAKVPKKKAASKPKKAGPSVDELIVKAVSASKERSGVSLAALKKALAAGCYDMEKNNSRVQTKGTDASGSFKLNKKAVEAKKPAKKAAGPKAKKVAAKKPTAAKKSPKKAKKPVTPKTSAKSPKKVKKPAAATKKAAKSPKKATKAAKPKAAKLKAAKAKKAAPKKK